ncbi:MAG: hypothetical protein Q9165_003765 [Trypethelium subeluteriae]
MAPGPPQTQILRHQLQPLSLALKKEIGSEMVYAHGELETTASAGIGDVYEAPYYSFFSWSDPPSRDDLASVSSAYQLLYDIIEEEGPFDGILGFSQGATLAAAFLLHHAKKNPLDLPFVHFKYAIFIAGGAPRRSDTEDLLPGYDKIVRIPTVHIVGKQDEAYADALELFQLCHAETATLLTYDVGHIIPRAPNMVAEMTKSICQLHHRAVFA